MTVSLLERAQNEGTPLVDGSTVTLLWHGARPPRLRGDFTHWHHDPALELKPAGANLWMYQTELPADAYIEYAFFDGEQRLLDPLNKRLTSNGLGKYNNYFYMPGGGITRYAHRNPDLPHGVITRQVIEGGKTIAGSRRPVYFYRPPVYRAVPLWVVWDGYDYLRRVRLPVIVDNLIAEKKIPPIALVMIHHGGAARIQEYSCNDETLNYLQNYVLPQARNQLHLVEGPGAYGVLGASMGGLMAMYTGIRLPELFGSIYSQSGSFAYGGNEKVIFPLVENSPCKPLKIYMEAGKFEYAGLIEANRQMEKLLRRHGYRLAYHEYSAGHNYPVWRDRVALGLEWLLAGNQADAA